MSVVVSGQLGDYLHSRKGFNRLLLRVPLAILPARTENSCTHRSEIQGENKHEMGGEYN